MEKTKISIIALVLLLSFAAFAQEKPKTTLYDKNKNFRSQPVPFHQIKTPLYLLDGKEISQQEFSAIKPETIESMKIIKDYSATALYGDKGNNGVVLITTKKTEVIAPPEQK